MATISEELRFRAEVKGSSDLDAGRKAPTYGKESELDWRAADTIDALVDALLGMKAAYGFNGKGYPHVNDTLSRADAALAMAKGQTP